MSKRIFSKRMVIMLIILAVVFGLIFGFKAFMGKMMNDFFAIVSVSIWVFLVKSPLQTQFDPKPVAQEAEF